MNADSIHIASLQRNYSDGSGHVLVVEDVANAPNSADSPTLTAYLKAEAADGYLPTHLGQYEAITVSVSDINGA